MRPVRVAHALRLRAHDSEHVHASVVSSIVCAGSAAPQRSPSCTPHQQLRAPAQQLLASPQRTAPVPRRALAVGKARRVAEVQKVLVRQLHEQLVQHGQAAHA